MRSSSLLLTVVLFASLAACGEKSSQQPTPDVGVVVDSGTDEGLPDLGEPDEGVDLNDGAADALNASIRALSELSQAEPQAQTEVDDPENVEGIIDGEYVCSVQKYRAAAEYNQMIVLDPTTDVIYPGALIQGGSVGDGTYIPLVFDRAPLTVSTSLENIDGAISRQVESPSLSTVRQAIADILGQGTTGATPASMSFEIESVHSQQQMQLALGANMDYASGAASVEGGFNFDSSSARSRIIVKFIQKYYSMDIDLPSTPADFFVDPGSVDFAALGEVSPMYVSSVTYGRLALFSVESSFSETELRASLTAAFDSGITEGSVSLTSEQQTILANSSIKGTILGGSGSSAASTIFGLDALKQYIADGGNYSADSPGAPMAYKLRYLSNNAIGNIVLSSEYQVRNCRPKSEFQTRYRVQLDYLECASNDDAGAYAEIYGHIYAEATDSAGTEVIVTGSPNLWGPYNDSQWQDILQSGGRLNVGKEVTYTFTKPDPTESTIRLAGSMREEDTGPDDNLGSNEMIIYLNELSSAVSVPVLTFTGDGNTVRAYFKVTIVE